VLCCAVLCCAVLCCAVLFCTVLCCAVLYCAVPDINDSERVSVVQFCARLSTSARLWCQQQQATNTGPSEKEHRANRNVTTKTVSAKPIAVEDPSAGGWVGYSQQIRYAIAPTQLIKMSVRLQAAHDNNPPSQATLYLMR